MAETLTVRLSTGESRQLSVEQAQAVMDRLWASTEFPGAALAATTIARALRAKKTRVQLDDWQSMAVRATYALDVRAD